MKQMIILLCLLTAILKGFSQDINDKVDSKYGFKDIKLEMKADSLLKTVKSKLIKGDKYKYAIYQIIDPKYLKIGEYRISLLTISIVFNKVYKIEFTAPDELSSNGVYNAMVELFGFPSHISKDHARKCSWNGNRAVVYFMESPLENKAEISFEAMALESDFQLIQSNKNTKTAKDF
jgi:hypothetical protein